MGHLWNDTAKGSLKHAERIPTYLKIQIAAHVEYGKIQSDEQSANIALGNKDC